VQRVALTRYVGDCMDLGLQASGHLHLGHRGRVGAARCAAAGGVLSGWTGRALSLTTQAM